MKRVRVRCGECRGVWWAEKHIEDDGLDTWWVFEDGEHCPHCGEKGWFWEVED